MSDQRLPPSQRSQPRRWRSLPLVNHVDEPDDSAPDGPPTGRLFRSSGAAGPAAEEAMLASGPRLVPAPSQRRRAEARGQQGGLGAVAVFILVTGFTVLIAFANAILTDSIGALTGIALVVVSAYAAATVSMRDRFWAVVTPPIAFLTATVTAGQLTTTDSGGFWVQQGLLIPFTLGQNVVWILVATAVAALTIWVRHRRQKRT